MNRIELKSGLRLRVIKPFKIEKPGKDTVYITSNAEGVVHKTQFLPVFTIKFYAPERLKGVVYGFKHSENIPEHFEIINKKDAQNVSNIA
jgi:hypothetical protein